MADKVIDPSILADAVNGLEWLEPRLRGVLALPAELRRVGGLAAAAQDAERRLTEARTEEARLLAITEDLAVQHAEAIAKTNADVKGRHDTADLEIRAKHDAAEKEIAAKHAAADEAAAKAAREAKAEADRIVAEATAEAERVTELARKQVEEHKAEVAGHQAHVDELKAETGRIRAERDAAAAERDATKRQHEEELTAYRAFRASLPQS
jgi:hypothetical protein